MTSPWQIASYVLSAVLLAILSYFFHIVYERTDQVSTNTALFTFRFDEHERRIQQLEKELKQCLNS